MPEGIKCKTIFLSSNITNFTLIIHYPMKNTMIISNITIVTPDNNLNLLSNDYINISPVIMPEKPYNTTLEFKRVHATIIVELFFDYILN